MSIKDKWIFQTYRFGCIFTGKKFCKTNKQTKETMGTYIEDACFVCVILTFIYISKVK